MMDHPLSAYQGAAAYAARIEDELRRLSGWQSEPPPDAAYESRQAFFADTMSFYQWLQFVLVPRIREIAAERGSFPRQSQVGAYAVRELDGQDEAAELIRVLSEFDSFIEDLPRRDGSREAAPRQKPVAEKAPAPPPEPAESPIEVARRYWQTRDPALLTAHPHPPHGFDTQLAERVFRTASAFVEISNEPEQVSDGVAVNTVLEAERGPWVIKTVLSKENDKWRVDINLSLAQTTMWFLRHHDVFPPYSNRDDIRGRAMQFWQHVLNHNDRMASSLVIPPSAEIPRLGEGEIDEFFWYLGHTEENNSATVRVLMNIRSGVRTWITRMVKRDGEWFVDVPRTLADSSGPAPAQ